MGAPAGKTKLKRAARETGSDRSPASTTGRSVNVSSSQSTSNGSRLKICDAPQLQKQLQKEFGPSDRRRAKSQDNKPARAGKSAPSLKRRRSDAANDSRPLDPKAKRGSAVNKAKENDFSKADPLEQPATRKEESVSKPSRWRFDKTRKRQILKSLVGILLVIAAGWIPALRLLQVSSVEAVVNARMVTLRTPIDGVIEFRQDVNVLDEDLAPGSLVATIRNLRIDRSRLNEYHRDLELALIEKDRLQARHASLSGRRDNLVEQIDSHRKVRIQTLNTQLDEITSKRTEFAARLTNAKQQRDRSQLLLHKKVVAIGQHQETENNVKILEAALKRVEAESRRVSLEHRIISSGRYFGDHYNDRSRSAIELESAEQMLNEVEADISAQFQKISSLRELLDAETSNVNRREQATIALPVAGRIWEPLVASGEFVNRGQPLVRLLDCTNALITTAVSEDVYNSLVVGGAATFILRESGEEFSAVVAQLSGVSSAPANLAILPSALEKEPYRATVRVSEISKNGNCLLGKTGRVIFDRQ